MATTNNNNNNSNTNNNNTTSNSILNTSSALSPITISSSSSPSTTIGGQSQSQIQGQGSSLVEGKIFHIMDGNLLLNSLDNLKFSQQFSTMIDYIDGMNYCERSVVMYALLKRMRYQDLKFLQYTIDNNLNQSVNNSSTQNSINTLVDDMNANNVSYLKDLFLYYKNIDNNPVSMTTNDLLDLTTAAVAAVSIASNGTIANCSIGTIPATSNSSLSSTSDKGSGLSCYGYDFRLGKSSSSSSDESNTNNNTTTANKYSYEKQKKESILYDFLNILPMLKPGNDEAKQVYMQIVPFLVQDAFNNKVPKDLVKYYLIYLLIHPGVNIDETNSLVYWLQHLDGCYIQSSISNIPVDPNTCKNDFYNELFLQTPYNNSTLNLIGDHQTNATNAALLSSGSSNASNASSLSTSTMNSNILNSSQLTFSSGISSILSTATTSGSPSAATSASVSASASASASGSATSSASSSCSFATLLNTGNCINNCPGKTMSRSADWQTIAPPNKYHQQQQQPQQTTQSLPSSISSSAPSSSVPSTSISQQSHFKLKSIPDWSQILSTTSSSTSINPTTTTNNNCNTTTTITTINNNNNNNNINNLNSNLIINNNSAGANNNGGKGGKGIGVGVGVGCGLASALVNNNNNINVGINICAINNINNNGSNNSNSNNHNSSNSSSNSIAGRQLCDNYNGITLNELASSQNSLGLSIGTVLVDTNPANSASLVDGVINAAGNCASSSTSSSTSTSVSVSNHAGTNSTTASLFGGNANSILSILTNNNNNSCNNNLNDNDDHDNSFSKNGTEILDFEPNKCDSCNNNNNNINSSSSNNINTNNTLTVPNHLQLPQIQYSEILMGNCDQSDINRWSLDSKMSALKTRRSNSLTTQTLSSTSSSNSSVITVNDNCSNSTENLAQYANKPRSFSLSIEPQHNGLTNSGSDTRLDDFKRSYMKFQTCNVGMSGMGFWLKSLRLHKYMDLFKDMTYEEMMAITEEFLQSVGVTKGASHKLALCIDKLKERPNQLIRIEQRLLAGQMRLKDAIEEMANIVLTPMKPIEAVNLNCGEENVALMFLKCVDLVYANLQNDLYCGQNDDTLSVLLWILDRCIHNEAFVNHGNQLKELKFKLSKYKSNVSSKLHHNKNNNSCNLNKSRWTSKNRKLDSKNCSNDRINNYRKNSSDLTSFPLSCMQNQPHHNNHNHNQQQQHHHHQPQPSSNSNDYQQQYNPNQQQQYKAVNYGNFNQQVKHIVQQQQQQQQQQSQNKSKQQQQQQQMQPQMQPQMLQQQAHFPSLSQQHRRSLNNLIVVSGGPQQAQKMIFKPGQGMMPANPANSSSTDNLQMDLALKQHQQRKASLNGLTLPSTMTAFNETPLQEIKQQLQNQHQQHHHHHHHLSTNTNGPMSSVSSNSTNAPKKTMAAVVMVSNEDSCQQHQSLSQNCHILMNPTTSTTLSNNLNNNINNNINNNSNSNGNNNNSSNNSSTNNNNNSNNNINVLNNNLLCNSNQHLMQQQHQHPHNQCSHSLSLQQQQHQQQLHEALVHQKQQQHHQLQFLTAANHSCNSIISLNNNSNNIQNSNNNNNNHNHSNNKSISNNNNNNNLMEDGSVGCGGNGGNGDAFFCNCLVHTSMSFVNNNNNSNNSNCSNNTNHNHNQNNNNNLHGIQIYNNRTNTPQHFIPPPPPLPPTSLASATTTSSVGLDLNHIINNHPIHNHHMQTITQHQQQPQSQSHSHSCHLPLLLVPPSDIYEVSLNIPTSTSINPGLLPSSTSTSISSSTASITSMNDYRSLEQLETLCLQMTEQAIN